MEHSILLLIFPKIFLLGPFSFISDIKQYLGLKANSKQGQFAVGNPELPSHLILNVFCIVENILDLEVKSKYQGQFAAGRW